MKLTKTLLAATFAFSAIASAQEAPSFSLSGEFRPRTEYFGHGQSKTALTGSEGYLSTSVRAALKATYKTESYTVFTSFQEVFRFGDRQQISPAGNGNLRVQEAWADIKLSETTTFKVGRQPISYDDQRILGGLGWAQQARTHDAGILQYSNEGYNLKIGGALNTPTSAVYGLSGAFSYREMAFVHANKKYGDLNLSALVLANTYQDGTTLNADLIDKTTGLAYAPGATKDKEKDTNTWGDNKSTLVTAGIHADYKLDALTLSANGYIQNGKRIGDTEVESAFLASLNAKYKVDKVTLGAGYEVISGKTDDSAAFFPLYGTNHAFNGLMDRFYVGNHVNNGGLNDFQGSISTKIAGIATTLTGHYFTENKDLDGAGNELGSEIDLVLAKQFKGFKLVGGYSQFFEPSGVTGAKDTQNWAWMMLIIAPKFL